MQALWRALVIPAFILAALAAAIQAPQQFQGTIASLGHTAVSFVQTQPQLSSAIVLVGALLLLSSSIVPLLGAGLVFLLIFAPGQLSRLLPPLPSLPTVPSWAVPEPVKSVRTELQQLCSCSCARRCTSGIACCNLQLHSQPVGAGWKDSRPMRNTRCRIGSSAAVCRCKSSCSLSSLRQPHRRHYQRGIRASASVCKRQRTRRCQIGLCGDEETDFCTPWTRSLTLVNEQIARKAREYNGVLKEYQQKKVTVHAHNDIWR